MPIFADRRSTLRIFRSIIVVRHTTTFFRRDCAEMIYAQANNARPAAHVVVSRSGWLPCNANDGEISTTPPTL